MMAGVRFRASDHSYTDLVTGERVPGVTDLLRQSGHLTTDWYTDEGRDRGSAVHRMCADHDLGLEPDDDSPYRGYVLAYQAALRVIPHAWDQIEQPVMHAGYRFAGTPDRVGTCYGLAAVVEIKSGQPVKATSLQCALQTILVADDLSLPAESIARFAIYLRLDGKFRLQQFDGAADYREARKILPCR